MRKLDPLFIDKFIKAKIPRHVIATLKGDIGFSHFYQTLRTTVLEPALSGMGSQSLALITDYMNVQVQIGNPPMKRETVVTDWYMRHFLDRNVALDSRLFIMEMAMLTIGSVIYDQVRERDGYPKIPEPTYGMHKPDVVGAFKEKLREREKEADIAFNAVTEAVRRLESGSSQEPAKPETDFATLGDAISHYQQDAPMCSDCGHQTVRNGACYKCLNCGTTAGC